MLLPGLFPARMRYLKAFISQNAMYESLPQMSIIICQTCFSPFL